VSRYKLRTSVHNAIRTDTLRIKSYYAQRYYAHRDSENQVALIISEAGIGKSRLAQDFHEQIAGTPHAWVEAAVGTFFQSTPFYAVTEMLSELLAWCSDESAGEAARATGSSVGTVDGSAQCKSSIVFTLGCTRAAPSVNSTNVGSCVPGAGDGWAEPVPFSCLLSDYLLQIRYGFASRDLKGR
jgi:hypothetical protein